MPQEWIGVRELGRRVGRKHRAVQRAVEEGRIPGSAVRRDARGRIALIEYHSAALAWAANSDMDQVLRSAEPLRVPAAAAQACAVQTSALDEDEREALILSPALEVAVLAVPTVLAELGVRPELVTEAINKLMVHMAEELARRRVDGVLVAELVERFRSMVDEERGAPGTWTT